MIREARRNLFEITISGAFMAARFLAIDFAPADRPRIEIVAAGELPEYLGIAGFGILRSFTAWGRNQNTSYLGKLGFEHDETLRICLNR